ncbi:histidine phosphatase family protein [Paracoccus stylophorae]|uniref:Histidine phosphatase family protein n=1 Tax=Paracoccus stylophorae TaxID=659350 RepID=A0ABY7SY18_9RHOB|nr:histidine phosphatase family protein [Paracoccus stylophorae]
MVARKHPTKGQTPAVTRLLILRHAVPLTDGCLAGRTDVDADCSAVDAFDWMRARIGPVQHVLSSPARRCLQTAGALKLLPDATSAALWEQDYGAWEGLAYDALPDLGRLPPAELARHRPEGGESFDDLVARTLPLLQGLARDTLIVGHAGTVRAALSMVVGPAALSFSVAPLSLTVLRRAGADWAVEAVNITAP